MGGIWLVGILFEIIGTYAGTWGKVCLSWIKTQDNAISWSKHQRLALICIFLVEPCFDTIAISLTAQSIMIPFNSLTLVFLLRLTARMFNQTISKNTYIAIMCIGCGCLITAMTGNHSTQSLTTSNIEEKLRNPWVFAYCGAMGMLLLLLTMFVFCFANTLLWSRVHRVVAGSLGGLFSGNLFLLKIALELFKDHPRTVWVSLEWWIFVAHSFVLGCSGSAMLSFTLSQFEYPVIETIALYQTTFILTGSVSAGIVFGDVSQSHLLIFLVGFSLIFLGMYILFEVTFWRSYNELREPEDFSDVEEGVHEMDDLNFESDSDISLDDDDDNENNNAIIEEVK